MIVKVLGKATPLERILRGLLDRYRKRQEGLSLDSAVPSDQLPRIRSDQLFKEIKSGLVSDVLEVFKQEKKISRRYSHSPRSGSGPHPK